jgi:prepilin-type N-terminal cleavage/methylation domain-containing protein
MAPPFFSDRARCIIPCIVNLHLRESQVAPVVRWSFARNPLMINSTRMKETRAFTLIELLVVIAIISPTALLFTNPRDERTEAYITGRIA